VKGIWNNIQAEPQTSTQNSTSIGISRWSINVNFHKIPKNDQDKQHEEAAKIKKADDDNSKSNNNNINKVANKTLPNEIFQLMTSYANSKTAAKRSTLGRIAGEQMLLLFRLVSSPLLLFFYLISIYLHSKHYSLHCCSSDPVYKVIIQWKPLKI